MYPKLIIPLHKKILKIEGADHNTIFAYGLENYMRGVKELVKTASS